MSILTGFKLRDTSVYDLSSPWAFTGPDNLPYKWQIFIQSPVVREKASHLRLMLTARACT